MSDLKNIEEEAEFDDEDIKTMLLLLGRAVIEDPQKLNDFIEQIEQSTL